MSVTLVPDAGALRSHLTQMPCDVLVAAHATGRAALLRAAAGAPLRSGRRPRLVVLLGASAANVPSRPSTGSALVVLPGGARRTASAVHLVRGLADDLAIPRRRGTGRP